MCIQVNGSSLETAARSVAELVTEVLGPVSVDGVAVAIGGTVIRGGEWTTTRLVEHDRVEIIRAVGGG